MKQKTHKLRTAILALSASIVLPIAPVFGQDAPVIAPPPPVVAPPPPVATPAPTPPAAVTPTPAPRAEAPARTTSRTTATRTARAGTVRQAAPARTAPAAAPAPVAAPAPATESVAVPTPLPPPEQVPVVTEEDRSATGAMTSGSILPWILIGVGLIFAVIAFIAFRRRRRDDTVYEEEVRYEEPVVTETAPEPSFIRAEPVERASVFAPAFVPAAATEPVREAEEPEVVEAANEDVEALAAGSAPVGNRPWIEFLMRPVRAGTSQDDAIVQFELTVGNTGDVAAKDVRISTWMVAAGTGTEHERSLINPPSDAQLSEVDIAAGDGARVEGELAIAKGSETEPVTPIVVADARYRLPDGSEGRTHAAFAFGLPDGEDGALTPFPVDRASGLRENAEARLHGEPERV